jgi:hypothetical protein
MTRAEISTATPIPLAFQPASVEPAAVRMYLPATSELP